MIISAKYNKKTKGWEVDEDTCNYYPALRLVLNVHGPNAIAYIVLIEDPTSPFSCFEDREEREAEVLDAVYGREKNVLIPKLKDAMVKYAKMCNTLENRLRLSYQGGADKLMKFVDSSKKIDSDNIKDVISVMKEMPNLISTVTELKKQIDIDNKGNAGKVKANRELSLNEKRLRGG